MLGRRRVFAVEPLGGRDGVGEDLARSCVVPGVSSTYRRIPDAVQGCSLDSWKGDGQLRGVRRQEPLLKLASRDSGVEMVVGDSPLATSPGLPQDSLDFEPAGSPEPPAHLSRLLANRKLEQVLERSRQLPTSPVGMSQHHYSLKPPIKPECEMPPFGAGEQEAAEAETDLEAGLEGAEVVGGLGPKAWACLPGQGLRYLEHLCLVLEQMARLQQLYLQLQTQRPPGDPEAVEGESARDPSPPPSCAPGSEVQELLSQTQETGANTASPLKVGVPGANPPRLLEASAEPAHIFPSSQGHKRDLSHWNKVKVLLNRIRWRSSKHSESPAPPDGPAPRIESRGVPERPPFQPLRKTFMPSFVVKKQRAKNLSVC
uniref:Chromosome 8 open reading frame 58 n=1 Tax=Panthera leo TaxID=9689 RepID=A0A8C8WN48_PANLE